MLEPLYQTKIDCLNCEKTYQTSRVRPSFKKPLKVDTDFCNYYNEDTNPEFYVVRVCPFCGFSSTENFAPLILKHKKLYDEKMGKLWTMKDYCGKRTYEEALQTYKLALLCAQLKEEKERVIAGILHHIAWFYRYKGDKEQERRFLEYTLGAYVKVYETEGSEINNARLMYMLGELNRRLSYYSEAIRWFGRVINDKKIMDASMIRASREQWVATREDMLAAKMELPEEMKESL